MIKQIPEQELSFKEALEIVINEAEVSAIGNRDDTQLQVLKAVEVVQQFSTYLPDSFNNDALPQKVSTIEPTDFSKDWNKMVDFHKMSKKEFLHNYSYITEEQYNLTRAKYMENL